MVRLCRCRARFVFAPTPNLPVSPLWTFTIGATTYDFNLTSLSVGPISANSIQLDGSGTLQVTGYTDTPGLLDLERFVLRFRHVHFRIEQYCCWSTRWRNNRSAAGRVTHGSRVDQATFGLVYTSLFFEKGRD